jgi:hypothetical protein
VKSRAFDEGEFLKLDSTTEVARTILKGVSRTVGPVLPRRLFTFRREGVPGRIHIDDQMFGGAYVQEPEHYLQTGREGVALIRWSLESAGRSLGDLKSCLLLPCGYGRVLRHLAASMNPQRITASDIDRQAVRFCAGEFGVAGLRSRRDFRHWVLPTRYDMIFVGSLLTHLPESVCLDLLELLAGALSPAGHLVFTTQGESCLDHLGWYGPSFLKAEGTFRRLVRESGVAFVPYPGHTNYGITIHAREYVDATIARRFGDLRLLGYKERGWDNHQDVWSYVARP